MPGEGERGPEQETNVLPFRLCPEPEVRDWADDALDDWLRLMREVVEEAEADGAARIETTIAEVHDNIARAEAYGGPKPVNEDGTLGQSPEDRRMDELTGRVNRVGRREPEL